MGRRNHRSQIWKYHLEWSTWCGSCTMGAFLDTISVFAIMRNTRKEAKSRHFGLRRKPAVLLMGKVIVAGDVKCLFYQTDTMLNMASRRRGWGVGGLLEWRVSVRIRVEVMEIDNIEMNIQEEKTCTSLPREKWKQEAAHFLWLIWRAMEDSIIAETCRVFSF